MFGVRVVLLLCVVLCVFGCDCVCGWRVVLCMAVMSRNVVWCVGCECYVALY